MVLEIAELRIKPGTEAQFEEGVKQAAPLFSSAKGCRSMQLRRSIETPELYLLFVEWETLEDHTVGFRSSENFAGWRALVSPYFSEPPKVQHVEMTQDNF